MNELYILGIKSFPNEEVVASRYDSSMQDGEIRGITNQRFIYLGASYPGPCFFDCTAPIETCRSIEYRRRNSVGLLCLGLVMTIAGTYGFFFCSNKGWWLLYWPCLTVALWGLPLLLSLFRLWWSEVRFDCGEDKELLWTLSGSKSNKERSVKQIREFAESRGISISNFPAV